MKSNSPWGLAVQLRILMFILVNITKGQANNKNLQMHHRKSLGDMFTLGALYDIRNETFCGGQYIFVDDIPSKAIRTIDAYSTSIDYSYSDHYDANRKLLDISVELSIVVIAELLEIKGSAAFLLDKSTSSKTKKTNLAFKIRTKSENLNIFHEALRKGNDGNGKHIFDDDLIQSTNATHVVTGITWGADSVVSCEYTMTNEFEQKDFSGTLGVTLDLFIVEASGEAGISKAFAENTTKEFFNLNVYADVRPPGEVPTTVEDAVQMIAQVPNLIKTINGGKGVPMHYRLLPISVVKNFRKEAAQEQKDAEAKLKSLKGASTTQALKLFDNLASAKQELNDVYKRLGQYPDYLKPEETEDVSNYIAMIDTESLKIKTKIATTMTAIKSGTEADDNKLDQVIKEFLRGKASPVAIRRRIETWEPLLKRIEFSSMFVKLGAFFLRPEDSLYEHASVGNMSYALIFANHSTVELTQHRRTWAKNKQLFMRELRSTKDDLNEIRSKYFLVDCGITNSRDCPEPNGELASYVRVYQGNHTNHTDLLAFQRKTLDDCGVMAGHLIKFDEVQIGMTNVRDVYDKEITDYFQKYNKDDEKYMNGTGLEEFYED